MEIPGSTVTSDHDVETARNHFLLCEKVGVECIVSSDLLLISAGSATKKCIYGFDLSTSSGTCLTMLSQLMETEGVAKVFHDTQRAARMLARYEVTRFVRVLDTQEIHRIYASIMTEKSQFECTSVSPKEESQDMGGVKVDYLMWEHEYLSAELNSNHSTSSVSMTGSLSGSLPAEQLNIVCRLVGLCEHMQRRLHHLVDCLVMQRSLAAAQSTTHPVASRTPSRVCSGIDPQIPLESTAALTPSGRWFSGNETEHLTGVTVTDTPGYAVKPEPSPSPPLPPLPALTTTRSYDIWGARPWHDVSVLTPSSRSSSGDYMSCCTSCSSETSAASHPTGDLMPWSLTNSGVIPPPPLCSCDRTTTDKTDSRSITMESDSRSSATITTASMSSRSRSSNSSSNGSEKDGFKLSRHPITSPLFGGSAVVGGVSPSTSSSSSSSSSSPSSGGGSSLKAPSGGLGGGRGVTHYGESVNGHIPHHGGTAYSTAFTASGVTEGNRGYWDTLRAMGGGGGSRPEGNFLVGPSRVVGGDGSIMYNGGSTTATPGMGVTAGTPSSFYPAVPYGSPPPLCLNGGSVDMRGSDSLLAAFTTLRRDGGGGGGGDWTRWSESLSSCCG